MMDIYDYILDYKNYNVADFVISDADFFYNAYRKINVYNKKSKIPMHKICLYIDIGKIYYYDDKYKIKKLSIVVHHNNDVVMFMNKMESFMQTNVNLKDKNNNRSSIVDLLDGNYYLLTINIPDNIKYFFDDNNNTIEINKNLKDKIATLIIELKEIWFNQHKFGFNWSLKKIKILSAFNEDKINNFICENNILESSTFQLLSSNRYTKESKMILHNTDNIICDSSISEKTTTYSGTHMVSSSIINSGNKLLPPPPPPTLHKCTGGKKHAFIPTQEDLLNKIKNLRKIDK